MTEVSTSENSRTHSQETLHNLAENLSDTPWPSPTRTTVTQLILGSKEKTDSIDPVAAYLEILQQSTTATTFKTSQAGPTLSQESFPEETLKQAPPLEKSIVAQVLKDAHRQLDIANAINQMAREAAATSRLSANDIAAVENSIMTLRENRTVFIDTLKSLANNGQPVAETHISSLKTSFVNAGRVLGKTANIMSDQLAGVYLPEQAAPIAADTAPAPTTIFRSDFTNFQ